METRNICIQRKVSECGVKYLGQRFFSNTYTLVFSLSFSKDTTCPNKGDNSIDHCIMVCSQCLADFHFKQSHHFLLIITVLLRDKVCVDTRILTSITQLHEVPCPAPPASPAPLVPFQFNSLFGNLSNHSTSSIPNQCTHLN